MLQTLIKYTCSPEGSSPRQFRNLNTPREISGSSVVWECHDLLCKVQDKFLYLDHLNTRKKTYVFHDCIN